MAGIRLYTRSVYRTLSKQWAIFTGIANSFKDTFNIFGKKEKINKTINSAKEKYARRKEIINGENQGSQSLNINLVR